MNRTKTKVVSLLGLGFILCFTVSGAALAVEGYQEKPSFWPALPNMPQRP